MTLRRSSGGRPIRIRACTTADVAAVIDFWRRSAAAPSVTDTRAALRRRLKRDRQLFLLAWDGPTLVGSIMAGWDGWRASIARLAVHPRYRRLGLAGLLVGRAETRLRALGARRVGCVVLRDNAGARAFWKNARYRLDQPALRYVKNLRQ
jgi:ribosomal protein S18 acetylase RimI-like enzyme